LSRNRETADYFELAVGIGSKLGLKGKQIADYIINKKPDIHKILPAELIQQILKSSKTSSIDESDLEKLIDKVLKENKSAVEDYKKGKENAIMFLVGQVMRQFKAKVDAKMIKASLLAKLDNDGNS
jgi:Asp-tRNA(Asn)/Glu-tRNA(Gln) amidotransferase B subunit